MKYNRMPIEIESPEEYGYENIKYNLSESSITDQSLGSLGLQVPDLKLLYNEHQGSTALRKLVIQGSKGLNHNDVLITTGAAGALFIIASSQLNVNDHLVVVRPNYATNLETPRALGCEISFIDLKFESGFQLDLTDIRAAIKPNTKIVSITTPHNPTGTGMSLEKLNALVELTKENGLILLVDETYADISYDGRLPIAASLGDHVISVSSLSKSYGIPGIRLGWLINKSPVLQETFLAAKEQISISGSVVDEWIAEQVLTRKDGILSATIREMEHRREIVAAWIEKDDLLDWVRPDGGIVCFPRIKPGFEPAGGLAAFYHRLLHKYGTYVGPGHWFELPDTYFRLGYDLSILLATMQPMLDPTTYVFLTTKDPLHSLPLATLQPQLVVQEDEGTTLVTTEALASSHGFKEPVFPCKKISLKIHSSLEAVGLIAAISNRLKNDGISTNVVSGYFHDHIYVPKGRAEDAMRALADLVEEAKK
ncbi:unnamed protein product [Penicillium bialowiezense]